ncbi:MAG: hypothetical protein ACRDFC_09025 [Ignavibacteria bacterium]
MKNLKTKGKLISFLLILLFSAYLIGCSENVTTPDENMTDDQYIESVVKAGIGSNQQEDDDLMSNEATDLDNGGPVGNNGGDTPIDSLIKWGRRITGVSVSITINSIGDSLKNVAITRTINGNYVIIGMVLGQQDTIVKPYREVLKRFVVFKRIAHTPRPRFNWKLFKISMVDGETTFPQDGSFYVEMNKVEVYINGTLVYTFNGPDFTQNIFTTRYFGGNGIPEVRLGDQVKLKVYTFSKQSETDIVAWHWARNTFGFHREPFTLISQTPNGQYWDRIYEKTFKIYAAHRLGRFNGYISASTHKSLYDDSPVEFASDLVGTPYRVLP